MNFGDKEKLSFEDVKIGTLYNNIYLNKVQFFPN